MEIRRKFEGVSNVILFNRHLYVLAGLIIIAGICGAYLLPFPYNYIAGFISGTTFLSTLISLLATFWIYDFSGLYKFKWLPLNKKPGQNILNFHAGFDEASTTLRHIFKTARVQPIDFFSLLSNPERSIVRARKTKPAIMGNYTLTSLDFASKLPSGDVLCCILSAHEFRNTTQRIRFFKQVRKLKNPTGKIVVVEHLRDLPNLLAYNVGAFHFYTKTKWLNTFRQSGLKLLSTKKLTPFLTIFYLE